MALSIIPRPARDGRKTSCSLWMQLPVEMKTNITQNVNQVFCTAGLHIRGMCSSVLIHNNEHSKEMKCKHCKSRSINGK